MEMKNLSVTLLFFVLVEVIWCEGCWKEEREALWGLNSRFGLPLSWQWEGTDCCEWEGVECNPSTGRVAKLDFNDLSSDFDGQTDQNLSLSLADLVVFKDLKSLNLSYIDWVLDCADSEDFETLSSKLLRLEVLDISWNYLTNDILPSLGGFTSLKELYLSGNELDSDNHIQGVNLEVLDLSYNNFNDSDIASALSGLSSLKSLNLGYSQLTPRSILNISKIRSLEIFDIEGNELNETILWRLGLLALTSLEILDLSRNEINSFCSSSSNIINGSKLRESLQPFSSIRVLSMNSNEIVGTITAGDFRDLSSLEHLALDHNFSLDKEFFKTIGELTSLKVLSASFCLINGPLPPAGVLQLPLHLLTSMRRIDVSDNNITGQIPNKNISSVLPNLQYLNLSRNYIQGSISRDFGKMSLLHTLDLSNNHLSGEIPKNISRDGSRLENLKLSHNRLYGPVFPSLKYLEELHLDDNNLYGSIPNSFLNSSLQVLSLGYNNLVGKLPSVVGNFSNLAKISLSNNHLEGSIPTCLFEHQPLLYLDVSNNNLMGFVPSFVNASLRHIHLSNNMLSGLPKRMFSKRSSIIILDLSYNEIVGSIQDMMEDLAHTRLNIFILKGNRFTGHLPEQICQIEDLSMLDLSYNNFFGPIPNCLGKMPFENDDPVMLREEINGFIRPKNNYATILTPNTNEKAIFTTKKRSYTYTGSILAYMSGIDLSKNKLNGSIPSDLGNLTRIRALNLSHNDLIGQIPASFSKLVQIESLDLSFNMLSDQIPPELNQLNSLAVIHPSERANLLPLMKAAMKEILFFVDLHC
ncbi:hypothetical protein V8G54_020662 [Vigna mungo]|uniref:Leucine-rich repeat-containing N-terminal plant-type domain-containing protein n=1 Tax=Vigna mungo TaxID=3915 RepID=A0AAQ3NCX6_VIGMU